MEIERGSTWNRWDFHIHTPYSILNNQFGFAPDPDYKGDTAKFDEYVIKLFSKAVENKVVGIGITDYFSIEGYKRICREYLDKPEKMQELFPDKELRRKIAKIYVFPNIELRVDNFVGEGAHSVNYHVLFSADIPCNIIENRFISRLDLSQGNNKSIPLNRDSIEQIGRDYKSSNPDTNGIDYLVGLSKITVNHNQIIETLNKCTDFADKYIITIPVDDKLSCLPWDGRDYGTRIALYKECHCLLSSNSNTREFALAKGHEEDFIREFGSIKPCIWGSDAHNYDSMFCPAQDRFCWIKAEPTFKGLQQILYEPDERVRIQKEMPEEKDAHQIIDHIEFMHEDFQDSPIYFSEGLTAIIGGKSTGKSILLHHIAKNIDPDQAKEREELVDASNSRLEVDAKVVWKDGASGKRKIIYIPQSWLNHIVDASSGNSQLNKMLQGIILQQEEISSANIMFKNNVADILEAAKHNILDYMACHKKIEECENFLRVFGRSDAFLSTIKKLKEKRLELSVENDITEDKLNEYTKLERDIREHNESLAALKTERSKIKFERNPVVFIPTITTVDNNGILKYNMDEIPTVKAKLAEIIDKMDQTILDIWKPAIQEIDRLIGENIATKETVLDNLHKEFEPLQKIVSKNDQMKKIEAQLQAENEKLSEASAYEKAKEDNISKAEELKEVILASHQDIYKAYNEFVDKVCKANSNGSELEFKAEVRVRKRELYDAIGGLFDKRNLRTFKDKYGYDFERDNLLVNEGLFKALWNAMLDGTLSFKAGNSIETALERLFSDWFEIHYIVKSGADTINNMSPGKKALVLLEMIVNLEKSNCPILIDQPENDLDNRSIYKDLVSYLKTKKHERQIILVTHNANIVVGADAEEVIIANQDGRESPNKAKRFEYRCGAIENVSPVYGEDRNIVKGVLNQKGIQEQICDVLEGGKDAFEKRRNKYLGMNLN